MSIRQGKKLAHNQLLIMFRQRLKKQNLRNCWLLRMTEKLQVMTLTFACGQKPKKKLLFTFFCAWRLGSPGANKKRVD
jgi:hypothetical protein